MHTGIWRVGGGGGGGRDKQGHLIQGKLEWGVWQGGEQGIKQVLGGYQVDKKDLWGDQGDQES